MIGSDSKEGYVKVSIGSCYPEFEEDADNLEENAGKKIWST